VPLLASHCRSSAFLQHGIARPGGGGSRCIRERVPVVDTGRRPGCGLFEIDREIAHGGQVVDIGHRDVLVQQHPVFPGLQRDGLRCCRVGETVTRDVLRPCSGILQGDGSGLGHHIEIADDGYIEVWVGYLVKLESAAAHVVAVVQVSQEHVAEAVLELHQSRHDGIKPAPVGLLESNPSGWVCLRYDRHLLLPVCR